MVGYLVVPYGAYVRMLGIKDLHDTTTARTALAAFVPLVFPLASVALTLLLPQPGAPGGAPPGS